MSIYSSNIVKLGEQSELFLAEGIVVFFGDNAPEELQDVAVVHELKPVNGDIVVGGGNAFIDGGYGGSATITRLSFTE